MIPKSTTLVFLGRSGCGKGTQIEFLMKGRDFKDAARIVMGDIFRKLAEGETLLGKKIKQILDKGGRQPWWLASHLWISQIGEFSDEEMLVIDGTPRTLEEAKLLDEVLFFVKRPKAVAVLPEVSADESRRRLLLRRRSDDTEARIKNRLDYYERDVVPVVKYYRHARRLIAVNGEQSREEVFKELEEKLEKYFLK